jgi:hypothetical protein
MRVRKITKRDYELRHFCLSEWDNSAPIGRILIIFEKFSKICQKIKFHYNLTGMSTLHDGIYDGISLILLRMRTTTFVSQKL